MQRSALALGLALLANLLPASGLAADYTPDVPDLPLYTVADPAAPEITSSTLEQQERFWPYQVALVRRLEPLGGKRALSAGTTGVLVRLTPDGIARVDFGRDGLHDVPLEDTDVVERANQIRRGEETKFGPNLAVMLGPRLLRAEGSTPSLYGFDRARELRGFLLISADPRTDGFGMIAAKLRELELPDGVLPVLLPLHNPGAAIVGDRLGELEWRIPFVFTHMGGAYARILAPPGVSGPALSLRSSEGRLYYASGLDAVAVDELGKAIAAAFGKPTRTASAEQKPASSE